MNSVKSNNLRFIPFEIKGLENLSLSRFMILTLLGWERNISVKYQIQRK